MGKIEDCFNTISSQSDMLNYRFYILKHEFIQDSKQEKEKKEARKEEPSWVK